MSGRAPLLGPDPGLSKDRRRFIIISIFDATLCILLWLICTVTKGDDWSKVFLKEVDIFDPQFIHHSLFDIVLCALCRMLVLLVCYAVLVVKHWAPVAITTSISSAFLIIKVMFFFSKTQGGLPQYLLVIASFSIAWFELWLMPFKVLPRERRYELHQNSVSVESPSSPRPPSARREAYTAETEGARAVRPRAVDRLTASAFYPQFSTDDEFRSALDFSSDEERNVVRRPSGAQIPAMLREIYEKALSEAETRVESLLNEAQQGAWKALRVDDPMVLMGPDGSYFIKADFPCSPLVLFDAAWKDVLKWNPQVVLGKTLLHIDPTTEVFYSVSAPALKGYVSSRDFVDIRRIRLDSQSSTYSGVFVSVESTICPANANKKLVRGHNGPSLIRVSPGFCPDGGPSSHLEWIMRTDLRGGLPKRLIQSSMLGYFVEHVERLKTYVQGLEGSEGENT